MFWFLLVALVVVVAAVTLVVVGGDDGVALPEAQPDRLHDPLPADRPVARADLETLRLPMTVRGYRMTDVDDVLGRLGAELAERDARIAELESALAGAQASAMGGTSLLEEHGADAPYDEQRYGERPYDEQPHEEGRPYEEGPPYDEPSRDGRPGDSGSRS
ncbi:cell division protein DivIVA [Streptomyces sp. NPDC004647]|uniref:cell division protein DivIVA n=1 Tax=Streptomyces sp. NPDC004647 TaxID=3154671 RepID=UPI0033BA5373